MDLAGEARPSKQKTRGGEKPRVEFRVLVGYLFNNMVTLLKTCNIVATWYTYTGTPGVPVFFLGGDSEF